MHNNISRTNVKILFYIRYKSLYSLNVYTIYFILMAFEQFTFVFMLISKSPLNLFYCEER